MCGMIHGCSVASYGLDLHLRLRPGLTLLAGVVLSAALPLIAFGLLKVTTGTSRLDALAAH